MKYWKRVDGGKTTTVESYSHDLKVKDAIEIDEVEFSTYLSSVPPVPVEPQRDVFAELDDINRRLKRLEPTEL